MRSPARRGRRSSRARGRRAGAPRGSRPRRAGRRPADGLPGRARRQASSITQRPIGTISRVSSATGMNAAGPAGRAAGGASAGGPRTSRCPRFQVDDRLVVQLQLAALQGSPQVILRLDVVEHARAHHLVEDLVAAAPALLGAVEGGVGVADQRLGLPTSTAIEIPMPTDEVLAPADHEGRASDSAIWSATRIASCSVSTASIRMANSSPPKRATVSPGAAPARGAARLRRAARRRRRARGCR